jgi:hypothetical protein
MNTSTSLHPQPKIWLRVTLFILFVALAGIGTSAWHSKLIFCIAMAGLFGTFPRSTINITSFEKQWFVFFVPVHVSRTDLTAVIQIETDVEEGFDRTGSFVLLVGFKDLILFWFLNWLFPWAGGDYKLWLRTKSDRRVLAWQGNGESTFRRNLEILKDLSGLPVTRG